MMTPLDLVFVGGVVTLLIVLLITAFVVLQRSEAKKED